MYWLRCKQYITGIVNQRIIPCMVLICYKSIPPGMFVISNGTILEHRWKCFFSLATDKCMHQSVSMAFRRDDNKWRMGKGMVISGSWSAHRTTQIQWSCLIKFFFFSSKEVTLMNFCWIRIFMQKNASIKIWQINDNLIKK